jgi:hypothetical protein
VADDPSNIVPLPVRLSDKDDPIAEAVREAGPVPTRRQGPDRRKPIWPAVITFLSIALAALGIAWLLPAAPDGGIRWETGLAFTTAGVMGVTAVLYARVRDFWR